MTSYLPIEQPIFFCNAAADVVDDEVTFVAVVSVVRDNADVCHALAVEVPGQDVAGLIVPTDRGNGNGLAVAAKERLQIRNPAMVNARVSVIKSPFSRIGGKIRRHIFMNLFLEIDARVSKRPDDDVRACSRVRGHVAPGIWYYSIILSIVRRYLDLFVCAFNDAADWFRDDVVGPGPFNSLDGSGRVNRLPIRNRVAATGKADGQDDQY